MNRQGKHASFCFAGQPAPCAGYFEGDVLPCICGVEGDVITALSQVALPATVCEAAALSAGKRPSPDGISRSRTTARSRPPARPRP